MRAVLTGTGLDVQPERLFGRLALRPPEPLGQAPQIGSEIARAKAALHREDLYPNGSIGCVIVNLDTVGDLLGPDEPAIGQRQVAASASASKLMAASRVVTGRSTPARRGLRRRGA